MFTRYTGKTSSSRHTSKTRRREERKRAKGKKGTVYEEEYLVNSVRRLMERVNSSVNDVEAPVEPFCSVTCANRAAAVEKALGGDGEDQELQLTAGSRVLEESIAAITGTAGRKEPPVVKAMKSLSLLA
ncbi:hypothetical protein N7493_010851 [Penicillium malachiteum]|uniref:ELP1 three-helical bundle domain-containing protein n=1 Tax=Penicillium malachiteum TaxID=1324776 RepID=A0AAD6HB20_9EURO|nr:hypothetical protein N7493_010851 [Penicillium malachiteum]